MRNTNSSSTRSTVQYSAVPSQAGLVRVARFPNSSTLFDDRYACYSLRVGPRLVAILLKTYGEEKVLSPSAITTVS